MSAADFADLQEALLFVFWPILVNLSGLAFAAGVVAAIITAAMQIAHGGRRKRAF